MPDTLNIYNQQKPDRSQNFHPPTPFSSLRAALGLALQGSSVWKDAALIGDFSHWDGDALDPKPMVGWVDYAIFKAGEGTMADPTFVNNIARFTDAGIPCGSYWFMRNEPYVGQQLGSWKPGGSKKDPIFQAYLKALKFKKCYSTALDVEAYINLLTGNEFDDGWVSKCAYIQNEWMRNELTPSLTYVKLWDGKPAPHLTYSADWFIQGHSPSMYNWLKNALGWSAHYPYNAETVICSWEEFYANHLPPNSMKCPTMNCDVRPVLQFTGDKFRIRTKSKIDLNFYMGVPWVNGGKNTRTDLYTWLGIPEGSAPPNPPEDPEIPEEPPVTAKKVIVRTSARLRSSPTLASNQNVVILLPANTVLTVVADAGEFYEVNFPGQLYIHKSVVKGE